MGTRDWTRAEWKLSGSLTPKLADQCGDKPSEEAVTDYLADCRARGLEPSTLISYENTLRSFIVHCDQYHCFGTAGVSVDLVTGFRSSRPGKTQKNHVADCQAKLKRAGRRNCDCPVATAAPSGKEFSGVAPIKDADSVLTIEDVDLSGIPGGKYTLRFAHADASWQAAPITIQ